MSILSGRENDMKKVITILLIILILTGCGTSSEGELLKGESKEPTDVSRFMTVEDTWSGVWRVVVDRETGVMYAVSMGSYNMGTFTLLVDREGKPLIWEGE